MTFGPKAAPLTIECDMLLKRLCDARRETTKGTWEYGRLTRVIDACYRRQLRRDNANRIAQGFRPR